MRAGLHSDQEHLDQPISTAIRNLPSFPPTRKTANDSAPSHPFSSLLRCGAILRRLQLLPGKPGPGPRLPVPISSSTSLLSTPRTAPPVTESTAQRRSYLARQSRLSCRRRSQNIQRITSPRRPRHRDASLRQVRRRHVDRPANRSPLPQMVAQWGNPSSLAGITPPRMPAPHPAIPHRGQQAFIKFCGQCHLEAFYPNGLPTGVVSILLPAHPDKLAPYPWSTPPISPSSATRACAATSSPARSLRRGQPEYLHRDPHDWRSYTPGHPMTDQEVTDVVAWLTSHRIATPGQPYPSHP